MALRFFEEWPIATIVSQQTIEELLREMVNVRQVLDMDE